MASDFDGEMELEQALGSPSMEHLRVRNQATVHKARRERIATAVLAGLAARPLRYEPEADQRLPYAHLATSIAVDWADALIAKLDETKEG